MNQEYMIRLPPIDDCKRAYLGEDMPFPDIEDNIFIRTEVVDGQECHYFLHEAFETRVHMYFKVSDDTPFKLIHESTEGGVSTPLLTYEYSNVVLGEPQSSLFDIPPPHAHENCTRHVGGFPYLHVFHYFAKF
jgi:hypothetical protein